MEKIKDISNMTLLNGQCLIEVDGLVSEDTDGQSYIVYDETKSGILTGQTIALYDKAEHAIRNGVLAKMPTTFDWNKASWITDVFPDEGDEVWFDYLDAKDSTIVKSEGKLYIVLTFFSLLIALSKEKGIIPLNGFILAQKAPIPMKELEIKQKYYDDIYIVKHAGKPNISYKDERHIDDPSITEGMTVMTRSSAYPILEESMYATFSKETYYYFTRKDVIAEVEL